MELAVLQKFLNQYLKHCRFEKGLDEKTLKAYGIDLKQYHTFLVNTDAIYSKESLQLYIVHMHEQYAIKSVKRKVASLKAYFNYLEYEELIEANPFARLRVKLHEPFLLPRTIPLTTIRDLLHCAYQQSRIVQSPQHPAVLRDIAVLELLFATGMRISELCSLKKEDINLRTEVSEFWVRVQRSALSKLAIHLS